MKNQFSTTTDFLKTSSNAVYLYKGLWKEHTVALLQSPRDNDKTDLISEIIEDLTSSHQVLYVNTENRADSFINRFHDNPNLMIYTPFYYDPDDPDDYADLVFSGLEEAIAATDMRTFIIDSITRIAAKSFGRNASPAFIMKRLTALQSRHNLTILVVAHSSTKSTDRALKNLADFEVPVPEENASAHELTEQTANTISPEPPHPSDKTARPVKNDRVEEEPQPAEPKEIPLDERPMLYDMFHHDSPFWHKPDRFGIY